MTIAEHNIDSRKIVVGDVHGCNRTFRHLVGEVIKLTRKDTLILLGDYINKGPDSKGVLDFIIELKRDGFEVIALRGNHEELLINAWEGDKESEEKWLKMGGDETLKSLRVNNISAIPQTYKTILNRMGYYLEMEEAFIVHAGFNFSIEDPFSDCEAMLTIRDYTAEESFLKGRKIIHGHTPIEIQKIRNQVLNNQATINIDAGCVYPHKEGKGYLAAIELGSWKLYEVKNQDVKVTQ